jgi:hypothetical protein
MNALRRAIFRWLAEREIRRALRQLIQDGLVIEERGLNGETRYNLAPGVKIDRVTITETE